MGPETSDDAGVYLLTPDTALVETCDVITPPADNPRDFGRIAAANALSDVYAMGARPVTAMNIAFFPACSMEPEILAEVLAGGQDMLNKANCCLVGGHTVEDEQFKYGLSVTGTVHPQQIIRNNTIRPGDLLLLTKPIGSGIISTAVKGEMATALQETEAVRWMSTLNRTAAELMLRHNPSACTDVTGFGLVGHSYEMTSGSNAGIKLYLNQIPLMTGVTEQVADGMIPAGCYRNRDFYLPKTETDKPASDQLMPLFDPQTSGGLLIAIPDKAAEQYQREAMDNGIFCAVIGEVTEAGSRSVLIV